MDRAGFLVAFLAGCLCMALFDAETRRTIHAKVQRAVNRAQAFRRTQDARDLARRDHARLVADGRLR